MKNIKILVAYHKESPILEDKVYLPIHVGKEHSSIELNIQGDNTGDNISNKNPIYCEMSAVYWAWKNLNADYYGLCHYRRIFTLRRPSLIQRINETIRYWSYRTIGNAILPGAQKSKSNIINISSKDDYLKNAYDFSNCIADVLEKEKVDIILPKPWDFPCSNNRQSFSTLGKYYFNLLDEVVKEFYPELYPFLTKVYSNHKLHAANMFILKKDLFCEYCTKIFTILEEHEKRSVELGYCNDVLKDKTYYRLSGYLAELLTNTITLEFISKGANFKMYHTMLLTI